MTASGELFASLPSGIDICYETFGKAEDPAILLIMGLGGPMGWWSVDFCEQLAAEGFHVVRYDNRDTGRSTKLSHHTVNKNAIFKAYAGRSEPPYGLSDFADDALGLLDGRHDRPDAVHLAPRADPLVDVDHVLNWQTDGRVAESTRHPSASGVGWQHKRVLHLAIAADLQGDRVAGLSRERRNLTCTRG